MSLDELKWGSDGLLPVVVSDAYSGEVFTLAYANREALEITLRERAAWFFSRSRNRLWKKGETSGNTQQVLSVAYDCDNDALLYRVVPEGPACHTGERSCFYRELLSDSTRTGTFARAIGRLRETIARRRTADPEKSYTAKLLHGGIDRIAKKLGEEATEVVIAAKNNARDEIVWEATDLIYHLLVLLEERGVSLDEVGEELQRRTR